MAEKNKKINRNFAKILPLKKILNIGHRGAKGHQPENTLPSFQKAFDLNADGIELDVHVCKTGEIVVIHDFTVDRTTNGIGTVSQLSLSEIKSLKINREIEVPTLDEVLKIVPSGKIINIELKGKNTAQPVSELIERYIQKNNFSYADFLVSSFDYSELRHIFDLNSDLNLGVLTEDNLQTAIEVAREISAKAIHPHFSLLTEENVSEIQREGFEIFPWTVNEKDDIERLKTYNVNGIITDFPEKI